MTAVSELSQAVLKKHLHECSPDELRQLANQFPYFGPAQILLAKKLQEENGTLYDEQVQKAALYFQNRMWMQLLLSDDGTATITPASFPVEEEKYSPKNDEDQPMIEQPVEQVFNEPVTDPEPNIATEPESIPAETANEAPEQPESSSPPFEIKRISPAPAGDLVFEPYHTVDYFASQGIKFREEEKPMDRFGQQLKSFTQWLKTLKTVPVTEITGTDTSADKKVEQLAEHSLAERHIVTEAMAEVWEKQGNKGKAEEIYRKLSLLEPHKSSYFATKIEALKKTS